MRFNARNWYWKVANAATTVFSSASGSYVDVADETYVAWLAASGFPSSIVSEAELLDVLAEQAPSVVALFPAGLLAYAAKVRYARETGGITLNGIAVGTDRETQAMLTGAAAYVGLVPSASIQWKMDGGTFVTLTAAQITAAAIAVGAHVQACFAAEAVLRDGVMAIPPTINTQAQIDAAFAAVA